MCLNSYLHFPTFIFVIMILILSTNRPIITPIQLIISGSKKANIIGITNTKIENMILIIVKAETLVKSLYRKIIK